MPIAAIRGAITAEENTKEAILSSTQDLLETIISENKLSIDHIRQIIFTATRDLTAAYPAVAARKLGVEQAALMCVQEMYVEGSLEKCIRVSILIEDDLHTQSQVKHCYLKGAKVLRPDLTN